MVFKKGMDTPPAHAHTHVPTCEQSRAAWLKYK